MASENEKIIAKVDTWLQKFIIGLDICPFAKIPYQKNRVRLSATLHKDFEKQLQFMKGEIEFLQRNQAATLSTTLAIVANAPQSFNRFLDFHAACEEMLSDLELQEVFHLVAFHPQFQFFGSKKSDRGNWVNRSPYPFIHLLRKAELSALIDKGIDGEQISLSNQKKLLQLNEEKWAEVLQLSTHSS